MSIEKEFVPYNESLELKELGFNESCFGYYYTLNGKDWKFAEKSEYQRLDDELMFGPQSVLLTPTFSQAFRFFREKYNLPSHIHTVWQYDWNNYSYQWHITENKEEWNCVEHFKTYEEAELECIIRLIDIVKKQNLKE